MSCTSFVLRLTIIETLYSTKSGRGCLCCVVSPMTAQPSGLLYHGSNMSRRSHTGVTAGLILMALLPIHFMLLCGCRGNPGNMGELTFRCSSHPHFAHYGNSLMCISQTHQNTTGHGIVLLLT